jgi:nucleotide-binding universal stress UspA family protein
MKLDRILVAVDGSDNSLAAVVWVAGLAAATGAEVVAVHALGLLDRLDGGEQVPSQANRDEITRRFEDDWCAPLDAAGVRSRRIVRDGNPVSVVLVAADDEDVDLIVLGSRGLGGYPELLLGSTSTQVAQHSSRPVTIVPTL